MSALPAAEVPPAPRWPAVVGTLLCLAGLGVAGYLTYAHYTTATVLACPEHGIVNCAKVTTSTYSRILGMPVAVLGLAYFAFMLVLQTPAAWRSTRWTVRGLRLAGALSGVGLVLWLLYAELFRLDAICLYCTAVHVLTFLLFVVTAVGTASTSVVDDDDPGDPSGAHSGDPRASDPVGSRST